MGRSIVEHLIQHLPQTGFVLMREALGAVLTELPEDWRCGRGREFSRPISDWGWTRGLDFEAGESRG
jgi:hypothetical protein